MYTTTLKVYTHSSELLLALQATYHQYQHQWN